MRLGAHRVRQMFGMFGNTVVGSINTETKNFDAEWSLIDLHRQCYFLQLNYKCSIIAYWHRIYYNL